MGYQGFTFGFRGDDAELVGTSTALERVDSTDINYLHSLVSVGNGPPIRYEKGTLVAAINRDTLIHAQRSKVLKGKQKGKLPPQMQKSIRALPEDEFETSDWDSSDVEMDDISRESGSEVEKEAGPETTTPKDNTRNSDSEAETSDWDSSEVEIDTISRDFGGAVGPKKPTEESTERKSDGIRVQKQVMPEKTAEVNTERKSDKIRVQKQVMPEKTAEENTERKSDGIKVQMEVGPELIEESIGSEVVLIAEENDTTDQVWIPELHLWSIDHDVLHSSDWVTDSIVYAAQLLLKKITHNTIKGFQSSQCRKTNKLFDPLPPHHPYLQILHVSGNHWVAVSNIVLGDTVSYDSVLIYDSLLPNSVDMELKKEICSFVRPKCKTFKFDIMNVQTQANLSDCGLYAIANATELVHGKEPRRAHYRSSEMRNHLLSCFINKEMTRFPLEKERRVGFGGKIRKTVTERIYCHCRMPNYDRNMDMVKCNMCMEWFHFKCVGIDNRSKWFCKDCKVITK